MAGLSLREIKDKDQKVLLQCELEEVEELGRVGNCNCNGA
jgi:hypothetical protein